MSNRFFCHSSSLHDLRKSSASEGDDDGACHQDREDGQVEGVGVALDAGVQIHSEDGAHASGKGHAEGRDVHVQFRPDDLVPGLVLFVAKYCF